MAYEFKMTGRVQFVDTDLAGIVHFTNFFRYMELAEHAFYRFLGFSIHSPESPRALGLPRVSVACKYRAPLYFEDRFETQLLVRDVREKTIRYAFYFRRLLSESSPIVASADLTIACVAIEDGHVKMKGIGIPRDLRDQLEVAPEGLLPD